MGQWGKGSEEGGDSTSPFVTTQECIQDPEACMQGQNLMSC